MKGKYVAKLLPVAVLASMLAGSLGIVNNVSTAAAQTPGPTATPSQSEPREFADPTFERTWRRTDWQVLMGKVKRSYFWGPGVLTDAIMEPYEQGPSGMHMVQYFDKSRMEINNPNGNRNDRFFVTNGLLTTELISGRMQTGDNSFVLRWPADIPLASDTDDANAPTYTSFRGAIARPDTNNVGKVVTSLIFKSGQLDFEHGGAPYANYDSYNVKNAYYEAATKHNIPDVFWTFLNATGPIVNDKLEETTGRLNDPYYYATGYPIADAYWASVKIEGKVGTPVLIQPYQRRVLTYVPSFPEGFKVQMGNIGQHYYDWRYKNAGQPASMTGKCPKGYPQLGFGKIYQDSNAVKFALGCQLEPEQRLTVERQRFERGEMIGVIYYNSYSGNYYEDVIALLPGGIAQTSPFLWVDENPSRVVPTPIPGLIPSPSNFDVVLGPPLSDLRQRLGKATAPAEIVKAVIDFNNGNVTGGLAVQYFDGGIMVYPNLAERKIYVLSNTTGSAHVYTPHTRSTIIDRWSVHDDTYTP